MSRMNGTLARAHKAMARLELANSDVGADPEEVGRLEAAALLELQRAYDRMRRKRTAKVFASDSIERRRVFWLWPGYIPRGKVTMLAGNPGCGKTTLALWIAARVSRGDPLPDPTGAAVSRAEPENVLVCSAEDDAADTLGPRLDAAGADGSRILHLAGVDDGSDEGGLVTLADVDVIDDALTQVKPALVILDPIQAYVGGKIDAHKANELRPLLTNLRNLAAKHETAIVCIAHLNKSGRGPALSRIAGSLDFGAVARAALFAGRVDPDGDECALIPCKSNLCRRPPSVCYAIEEREVSTIDGPAQVGTFVYRGQSGVTEQELLGQGDTATAFEDALAFVRAQLEKGPLLSDDLRDAAKEEGISFRTLQRARKELGVVPKKTGEGGKWRVSLPNPKEAT